MGQFVRIVNKVKDVLAVVIIVFVLCSYFSAMLLLKTSSHSNTDFVIAVTFNPVTGDVIPVRVVFYEAIQSGGLATYYGISSDGSPSTVVLNLKYVIMISRGKLLSNEIAPVK